MVFEKIKSFLFGEEEEREETVERQELKEEQLSVSQVRERLEEKKSKPLEQMEKDVGPMLGEISALREKIVNLGEEFENATTEEDVHPNIYKSANEAKRLLLSKMNRAVEKIEVPEETEWNELLDFNRSLQDSVNLLKNAKVSHGNQVTTLFEREMAKFNRLANELRSFSKDLNTALRKAKLRIDDFDEILDKISEREELLESQEKLEEELENLKARKKEIKGQLEKERESLKSLKKSERFEELKQVDEKIENLSQKKEKIFKKIDTTISDLHRPFRKLNKMIERDEHMVGSDVLDALDSYLDDPVKAAVFEEEDDLPKLRQLLKELETVLEDKMKLDDRERRKRLEEVRDILDSRKVKEFRDECFEIEEKIEDLKGERESSSLLEKKDRLEESVQDKESELERIDERIQNLESEIEEIESQLNEMAVEIREEVDSTLGVWVKNL